MTLVTVTGKAQQGLALGDDGVQLLVPMDAIVSMFEISNVWLIGPTFDMLILDGGGASLNPMPSDGMKLRVTMGDSINPATYHDFRCVGSPVAETTPRGPAIRISAILDAPKLFHTVCREPFTGTSTDAISKYAQDCGLVLQVGDETRIDKSAGDSMKWLPMGRKYGYMLANIASHGWFGDTSAASVVGVTLDKQVVYRDLAKLAKTKPKYAFYYGVSPPKDVSNCFVAHDMLREDLTTVGVGQVGYAASRTRFNLDGVLEKLEAISVTQGNERINIGSKLKSEVGLSRVMLAALDCGNTHDNYNKAEHQNLRYRATYGRQVAFVVSRSTEGPDLLDPVVGHYLDPKTQASLSVSGVITAKIRAIVNGFYVERFNIAYQGEDVDVIT